MIQRHLSHECKLERTEKESYDYIALTLCKFDNQESPTSTGQ